MSSEQTKVVSIDGTPLNPGIGHNQITESELRVALRPGMERWKNSKELVEKSRKISDRMWDVRHEAHAELRMGMVTLSAYMSEGRALFKSDKAFGRWLLGQFAFDIRPHERAALIKMGRVPEAERETILRETKFWSARKIWDREFKAVYGSPDERAIAAAEAAQAEAEDEYPDNDNRKFEDGLLREMFRNGPDLSEDEIYNALEILACRLPLEIEGGFGLVAFSEWLGRWVKSRREDAKKPIPQNDADA